MHVLLVPMHVVQDFVGLHLFYSANEKDFLHDNASYISVVLPWWLTWCSFVAARCLRAIGCKCPIKGSGR